MHIIDLGAALTDERQPYQPLLDKGLATLSAFDADERRALDGRAKVYREIIADGGKHRLYVTPPNGMTSIMRPCADTLAFFNGFSYMGRVLEVKEVQSVRMDDVPGLEPCDYLKMDIQGAELMAIKGGERTLQRCVAIHTEVSFIPLYQGQPTLGEIDCYMRSIGFVPHCFTEVKRWSIAPTLRNDDPRDAFNQLLEADVLYVKDPLKLYRLTDDMLRNLALIADCYGSPDLAAHVTIELERRGTK